MIIRLVEVRANLSQEGSDYQLEEIFVNPKHIVCLKPDNETKNKLTSGRLPENLDSRQQFTRVFLEGAVGRSSIVVVGSANSVKEKLEGKSVSVGRTLLRD